MQVGNDALTDVDELVQKAQEGNAAAFAGLYEHFFDRIFRYVAFKAGSPVEAEDITGNVFVKMLESIDSFRWQGHPFSSWLFRIAHNMVVDHFRRQARKKTVPLDAAQGVPGTSSADLHRQVEVSMAIQEVHGAMEGLTSLQREVISLRFAAGLSVSETARAVRKKENAVKALQHAGLKKLRRLVSPEREDSRRPAIAVGDWEVRDEPRV